jgi:hypothetical protein
MAKCLFLKDFQAEDGIFAISKPKIQTLAIMPLKISFIPGFRGLLTDWPPLLPPSGKFQIPNYKLEAK